MMMLRLSLHLRLRWWLVPVKQLFLWMRQCVCSAERTLADFRLRR